MIQGVKVRTQAGNKGPGRQKLVGVVIATGSIKWQQTQKEGHKLGNLWVTSNIYLWIQGYVHYSIKV